MSTGTYARYSLLSAGAGVTSLNTLTGAVIIAAGTGISITPAGQTLTISTSALLAAITSINADTTAAQTLSVGTSGTDFALVDAGGGSHVFNLPTASAVNRGALSSADWTTFNNKQAALTIGDLTDAGTDGIMITGGTGAVIGSGTSIAQQVADATHNGYLSSADWNTFSGKQSTITIGALDAQAANATGLALVSNVLSTQSADASNPGLVSTAAQTFGGTKTLSALLSSSASRVFDTTDPTKTLIFDLSAMSGSRSTTLAFTSTIASNRTITFPSSSTTLVGTDLTQTLTNKTIDGASIVNSTVDATNTVTLLDNAFTLQDNGDTSKQLVFSLGNQTAGATTTLVGRASTNRSINLPNADCTILGASSSPAQYTVALGAGSGLLTSTGTGTAGQPLLSGGPSANPDYGTLAIGAGGTGQVTKAAAFDALSPMTTKGDIIAYSTTGARLPVGANGSYLIADSAETTGLRWSAAGTSSLDIYNGGNWTSFTPTGSWSTNTTYTGLRRRVGDEEEFQIQLDLAGAPTSASLTVNLPVTIDTAKLTGTTENQTLEDGGSSAFASGGGNSAILRVEYNNTTSVRVRYADDGANFVQTRLSVDQANPFTFASGDKIFLRFKVPVSGYSANTAVTVIGTAAVAPTVQKFTSGSGTYTLPSSPRSPLYIRVRMVGGGGGGSDNGDSENGDTGGNTTFGTTLLVANGGVGGGFSTPAAGGTASLGTGPTGTALSGGTGQAGTTFSAGGSGPGGNGGGTPFGSGAGGGGVNVAGANGAANTGAGGGGAGPNGAGNFSGAGGGGGGFVDAIITSPSSTYSYAVGAGGAGGNTAAVSGGSGGSGYIEVTEFYQ